MSRGSAQLAVQPAAQISVQSAAQLAVQSLAKRCVRCSKKEKKIRKSFTKFCSNFEIESVQRIANLVVLEKCCKMRIWVQKSASMQKRTSPLKFGDLAEKSVFI